MKTITSICLAIALLSTTVQADETTLAEYLKPRWVTSKGGETACPRKSDIIKFFEMVHVKDFDAAHTFFNDGSCIRLKPNLVFWAVPGMDNFAELRLKGTRFTVWSSASNF